MAAATLDITLPLSFSLRVVWLWGVRSLLTRGELDFVDELAELTDFGVVVVKLLVVLLLLGVIVEELMFVFVTFPGVIVCDLLLLFVLLLYFNAAEMPDISVSSLFLSNKFLNIELELLFALLILLVLVLFSNLKA